MVKTTINLLPVKLDTQNNLVKAVGKVSQFGAVFGVILVILGLVSGAYMLYLQSSISSSIARAEASKSQIASLSTVEQQYLLVQDRVGKLKPVVSSVSAEKGAAVLQQLIKQIPPSVILSETDIKSNSISFTFLVSKSSDLLVLFDSLSKVPEFEGLNMENFSFNPASGFLISIQAIIK